MIEALKQALEALKDVGVLTDREWQAVHKNKANELRQVIKELEIQEPVAWMRPSKEGYDSAFRDHRTVISCIEGNWIGWIPLYTHPPQEQQSCDKRTWVGLTDEEIEVLFQTAADADEEVHIRFARAIEAKLKELNDHGI